MAKVKFVSILCIMALLAGCAPYISETAKYELEKDIDCSAARWDIEILEGEKASTSKKMAAGLRSVMPASVVVSIFKGEYSDGTRVAGGSYNRDIDEKIKEIRDTCNIR